MNIFRVHLHQSPHQSSDPVLISAQEESLLVVHGGTQQFLPFPPPQQLGVQLGVHLGDAREDGLLAPLNPQVQRRGDDHCSVWWRESEGIHI